MPRSARVVVPGYPHHVTQRGARKQRTFFTDDDYREYLRLVQHALPKAGIEIWAYCLMPNHVHFVAVPEAQDGLAALFKEAHRRYTRYVNFREGWKGHLWQERFYSFCMDERHLLAAVRYIELNPVRSGLCRRPRDWPWSSVHAHQDGVSDPLLSLPSILAEIRDWSAYLGRQDTSVRLETMRLHGRTGRPAGDDKFVERLESLIGRTLRKQKPGPKPGDK